MRKQFAKRWQTIVVWWWWVRERYTRWRVQSTMKRLRQLHIYRRHHKMPDEAKMTTRRQLYRRRAPR